MVAVGVVSDNETRCVVHVCAVRFYRMRPTLCTGPCETELNLRVAIIFCASFTYTGQGNKRKNARKGRHAEYICAFNGYKHANVWRLQDGHIASVQVGKERGFWLLGVLIYLKRIMMSRVMLTG